MKKIITILLFLLIFFSSCFFIFSCKKDKPVEDPIDFGYNYLPDDTGRYIIYLVDSIHYDDVGGFTDTFQYQLKEKIASTFIDNSGRTALRLERFWKNHIDSIPYDSINWQGPRVWFANKTSSAFEKVEENVRYLRLVFPMSEGKQWNGNAYNTLGEKEYEVVSADQTETVNNLSFDSAVNIKQFENINFIESIYESEKYARNVGLIYKQRDSIYTGGTPKKTGYSFIQKIISYGK